MTKTELINKVSEVSGLPKNTTGVAVENLFQVIMDTVANGEKVQITGFGSFERAERAERPGVNPKTGEPITIAASRVPKFKAGKEFKNAVK